MFVYITTGWNVQFLIRKHLGHLRNVLGFSDTNIWFLVKMKITFEINFVQLKWFNSHYTIY